MNNTELVPQILHNGRGQPAKYTSPKQLANKIQDYFDFGAKVKHIEVGPKDNRKVIERKYITITGLTLYLGFANRASYYDMEKVPKFSHILKRARTFIESEYEELLQSANVTGAIFALKQFGWVDRMDLKTENTPLEQPKQTFNVQLNYLLAQQGVGPLQELEDKKVELPAFKQTANMDED